MSGIVELENLSKYYGKTCGIEDVTFSISEGEVFGFIGPNGAGKSTTIRTMLSLIHKSGGSAKIFGLDCHKHRTEILGEVGYLPSEVFYYDRMTAEELLRYAASFYKKDCLENIYRLADALSLDLHERIENMSFGNRKKVGIVQCLLHRPRLIILDEPTGGLDPLMQKVFFELIEQENKNGASVLLSSHVLGEVQRFCDTVAIIKDGIIVSMENMKDLAAGFYKKVHITTKTPIAPDYRPVDAVDTLRGEHYISFMFKGDGKTLINSVASLDIADITIQEPTLEEVFMNFYEFDEDLVIDTSLFLEEKKPLFSELTDLFRTKKEPERLEISIPQSIEVDNDEQTLDEEVEPTIEPISDYISEPEPTFDSDETEIESTDESADENIDENSDEEDKTL